MKLLNQDLKKAYKKIFKIKKKYLKNAPYKKNQASYASFS